MRSQWRDYTEEECSLSTAPLMKVGPEESSVGSSPRSSGRDPTWRQTRRERERERERNLLVTLKDPNPNDEQQGGQVDLHDSVLATVSLHSNTQWYHL